MKYLILSFTTASLLCSCSNSTSTVSASDLKSKTRTWNEPKVAIWYYVKTQNGYDYFDYLDLGIKESFRVPAGHFSIPEGVGRRVMPWGPMALGE